MIGFLDRKLSKLDGLNKFCRISDLFLLSRPSFDLNLEACNMADLGETMVFLGQELSPNGPLVY